MATLTVVATLLSAAICGFVAYRADRSLRAFRLPHAPSSAYRLPIIRIRSKLYDPNGHGLVRRAWGAIVAMAAILILGLSLAAAFAICAGPQSAC